MVKSSSILRYLHTLEKSLAAKIPVLTDRTDASQTAGRMSNGVWHPAATRTPATVVGIS